MKKSLTIENLDLDEQPIEKAVFDDRVKQLMARERNVSLSGPFASAYLAFLHYGVIELRVLMMWWFALLVCDATTFISTNFYLRNIEKLKSGFWVGVVIGAQSAAGVVWGITVYLFMGPSDLKYEFYTLVILVGVGAVTSVALLPFRIAFIGFLLGIWLFPFLYFLYLGEVFYINFAIGIVVMVTSLITYQSISTRQFVDGIEQKFRARMLASQLEKALQQLENLAIYDELTGVYNRRFGLDCLQKEKRLQRRHGSLISIVIIDIDLFKSINDQHGHQVGDDALVYFTKSIQQELREADTFFRYGGEEFILIMPQTNAEYAFIVADRLRAAISRSAFVSGQMELTITASFGVAEAPIEEEIDRTIDRADRALYEAKRNGRDRVELAHHDEVK